MVLPGELMRRQYPLRRPPTLERVSAPSPADLRTRLDGLTLRDANRLRRRLDQTRRARNRDVQLARIADDITRGEALIAGLRARESAARATVAGRASGVPVVFWFSSKDVKGDAFVAGKNGAPAFMMQALGARNVVTTEDEWPLASWEAIAAADPAVAAARAAETALRDALAASVEAGDERNPAARLLRTQLTLVWLQIDALRAHADEWLLRSTHAVDGDAGDRVAA